MIRRDVIRPGRPDCWMLISQVAHARLSYELAREWQQGGVAPLEPRDEVLQAVLHHDDGWAEWERSPDVDSKLGRPLSFLEMPIDEAVDIWWRSIAVAQSVGPVAAYLVSAHFSALVERAHDAHLANPHWLELVDSFLQRQARMRGQWLSAWQSEARTDLDDVEAHYLAQRGLKQLQLFDALSLWFCMAERSEPVTFDTPDGPPITWNPVSPAEVTVDPWPWPRPELQVEVTGRMIPMGCYPTREALSQAPSETALLGWILRPAKPR